MQRATVALLALLAAKPLVGAAGFIVRSLVLVVIAVLIVGTGWAMTGTFGGGVLALLSALAIGACLPVIARFLISPRP